MAAAPGLSLPSNAADALEADLDKIATLHNARMAKQNPPILMHGDRSLCNVPPNTQFQGKRLTHASAGRVSTPAPDAAALPL